VFDRFDVQRLASDALDKVRRAPMRAAADPESAKAFKKSCYALLETPGISPTWIPTSSVGSSEPIRPFTAPICSRSLWLRPLITFSHNVSFGETSTET
jgi:hypothetical protein